MNMKNLKRALFKIAEHKQLETSTFFDNTASPIYGTPHILSLTQTTTGTEFDDRIGDKVTGTFLTIRFGFQPIPADGMSQSAFYRIIVFIWKDDTTPTFDDIFDAPPTAGQQIPIFCYDSRRKVKSKILLDMSCQGFAFWVDTSDIFYCVDKPVQFYTVKMNLAKLKRGLATINYQSGVTSVGVNNIYLMVLANFVAAADAWGFDFMADYRYVDM